jgi:hypothetical protein
MKLLKGLLPLVVFAGSLLLLGLSTCDPAETVIQRAERHTVDSTRTLESGAGELWDEAERAFRQ